MGDTWAEHWNRLATASLLGTDRRPSPTPPLGPLADAVAQVAPLDDAESVLTQVVLLVAARRAGVQPGPPAPALAPAAPDDRRLCPPAAARRLPELATHFPSLVDEWLDRIVAAGYRLPPDIVVTLLGRHRDDARRRLVEDAAGPLAPWLAGHFPRSFARGRRGLAARPEPPPLPADLAGLVDQPAEAVADALAEGLATGRYGPRLRASLVQLVGLLPPSSLPVVAEALSRAGTNAATLGLTLSLGDLARTRSAMITELAAPITEPPTPPTEDGPVHA